MSQAQIDQKVLEDLAAFNELFEAEVLRADGENYEMRVLRVFKGQLQEGMILRGNPPRHSCMTRELKKGDRGYIWVTFGSGGPRYVGKFVGDVSLQSLRRLKVLPDK